MKIKIVPLFYFFYKPIRKIYYFIVRPTKIGVRAIILNEHDHILLVRHTYTKGWYLPGGGIDRRETVVDALKRELHEELGITSLTIEKCLGIYTSFFELKTDHIAVFVVKSCVINDKPNTEIAETRYFGFTDLPSDISQGSKKRIWEYKNLKEIDYLW